jgi:hypothetical protein
MTFEEILDQAVAVAYPRPADNVSRPLLFRLRRVIQLVVST